MGKDKSRAQKGPGGDRKGGDLEDYFARSRAASQRRSKAKMAPAPPSPARSESSLQSQVSAHGPLSLPGEPDFMLTRSRSNASLGSGEGWDMEAQIRSLHSYIRSLPTKTDFEQCVSRIERAYKKEISDFKKDVGARFEDLDATTEGLSTAVKTHDKILNSHTVMLQQLAYQQDDIENRNRRNNIRIRGIPESVDAKALPAAETAIFNQLLQRPKDDPIELDRVHRTSGPQTQDPSFIRDTLCRIHFYKIKESIMRAASSQDTILFNNTPVMLLPDLSRQTLMMRKALKPLTLLLQSKQIKYQWRFPFHLRVHHEGKTAIFRNLGDLPTFLSTLELPQVAIPDWPFTPSTPGLPFASPWQTQGRRRNPKSLHRRDSED